MDILSANCPGIAQKLVNVVIEMLVRRFDDVAIETCDRILIKMGVSYTCLTSIQGKYQIDCIQMLNKSIIYCNVIRRALSI